MFLHSFHNRSMFSLPHLIFIFSVYAWTIGYALSTLLKTCEGENLEDCVHKAESLLQDPDMTFPDDNQTLQSVCRMWEDMTGCTYNYTARCLTLKENVEFHQYFQEPIASMKTVCTDKDSTEEYFRHAHCIKKISTGENFCATQYRIMIDQIMSVTISTMRKICCALTDFKDCVMQANINNVCEGEGLEGISMASYALRTLEKSLLAFVAHSCAREGYHQERCREDEDPLNELSHLRQEARWDFPFGNHSELQYTIAGAGSEIDPTAVKPQKPLLVPIVSDQTLDKRMGMGDFIQDKIRANISHFGGRGFQIPKFDIANINKSMDVPTTIDGPHHSSVLPTMTNNSIGSGMENKLNHGSPTPTPQIKSSSPTIETLGDKVKNMTGWFQNLAVGNISKNMTGNNLSSTPMTEKRIDSVEKIKETNLKEMTSIILNSTTTENKNEGNKSSRGGAGRSLNFIDSVQNDLGGAVLPTIKNVDMSQKPFKQIFNTTTTLLTPFSSSPTPSSTTSTTISTITTTTMKTTLMTTTIKSNRESRIMNVPSGNSLTMLNQALGLSPPATTAVYKKNGNDGKAKKKALLNIHNNTSKAEETKNSGNFSVSDVPIRVFMVWLSTFFV